MERKKSGTKIRASIVEGIFYPGSEEELKKNIEELLGRSDQKKDSASGIMVPHAGYRYTGQAAADCFIRSTEREISEAVVISPVTGDPDDDIFLSDYDFFETPLGNIKVDVERAARLKEMNGKFIENDLPFMEEHSIEVQLPFIRYLFPEASLLPIHLGKQNVSTIKELAKGLKTVFDGNFGNILFIVSGNTSGYLEKKRASECSENFINLLKENNYNEILKKLQTRAPLPNSAGCAAAVMSLLGKNLKTEIISVCDSGNELNDPKEKIVCYASAAFFDRR